MDRGVIWILLPLLVGGFLIVTAPPDPQYSVSVYGPTDVPESETAVAFQNLSEENRALFLETFDDGMRFADPPDLTEIYVSYEGEIYQMTSSVHEGSVFSLLVPPLGGLFIFTGCLVAVYRHLNRTRD
jgi:hypothetical protein